MEQPMTMERESNGCTSVHPYNKNGKLSFVTLTP